MKSRSQVLGRGHLGEHIQPSGFPRWLSGKASARQCRRHRRHGFDTYASYSCLGSPTVGYSPWGQKSWTRLSEHTHSTQYNVHVTYTLFLTVNQNNKRSFLPSLPLIKLCIMEIFRLPWKYVEYSYGPHQTHQYVSLNLVNIRTTQKQLPALFILTGG